jgi:gamma-glutamyltranspeptidase/glutathione hydrolase
VKPDPLAPRRGPVVAPRAMVVTSHPQATLAGIDVLRSGGNAVDAAVAVAFLLAVLKPARCGLGGDLFFLIYNAADGQVTAINGSGAAPTGATRERYADGIPQRGLRAATVPGFVDGALVALERFGTRPRQELMAPAIAAARDGFPASLRLVQLIEAHAELLGADPAAAAVFLSSGRPPSLAASIRQFDLAATLMDIAEHGRDGFYKGRFARALVAAAAQAGAGFTPDDLAAHTTVVREPVAATYRGLTIYEQPPVSRGFALLEMLRILDGFELAGRDPLDPDVIHLMVEAKKIAYADAARYAGDPDRCAFDPQELLAEPAIAERRARIDPRRALVEAAPASGTAARDTTSFCVVDEAGNAVAAIQSIFHPWGSGVIVPGTGVLMNNRLLGFTLQTDAPNVLEPRKRPMHTLNAYIVTRRGRPLLIGCTPGGHQQLQTNLQVLCAAIDGGYDIQTAIDLPRWGHGDAFIEDGRAINGLALESRIPTDVAEELGRRGHEVRYLGAWETAMGRVTAIAIDPDTDARCGAVDLRGEGLAMGY